MAPHTDASSSSHLEKSHPIQVRQVGWVSTNETGIGACTSRSTILPPANDLLCATQGDMVKILGNTTTATYMHDANRVAHFIMRAKQPQAMVSVAFRTLLDKALLDSTFATIGPKLLHNIFLKVAKEKNPALGLSTMKPKKFFYSATEVARKSFNSRGDSKARVQWLHATQRQIRLMLLCSQDGLENYLSFTLGAASLFKKKFTLRVMELVVDNIDNDAVVAILLDFIRNGGDQWISRLGAPRRQKSTNASFEKVYARMTMEGVDPHVKEMLEVCRTNCGDLIDE